MNSDEQYTAHVPTDEIPNEEAFWRAIEIKSDVLAKQQLLADQLVRHPKYRSAT